MATGRLSLPTCPIQPSLLIKFMNLSALHLFVPRLRRWSFEWGITDRAARTQKGVRMLMHHGIDGAYQVKTFEEQLVWIKSRYTVLSMAEAVERLLNARALPDFAIVLTFDDGLRNNLTEAYPLLLKHQVPATFFVCPGLIDSGLWIWTYDMRERLKTLSQEELVSLATQVCGSPLRTIETFVAWMKKQPNAQRHHAMEQVRAATPAFEPGERLHRDHDLMSWAELHSLDQRLITIGSHTMSHPILPSLCEAEIETELKDSKAALLEHGLIREPALLCYPDGANDERVIASARRHYAAACSTKKGLVTSSSPLFALPRIGANSRIEDVSWRLWRPGA
jgi:peptidoglycan/xylan/chitin deacetylase (PgdA/CDA1 family)